jgi:FtsP/CotA-like multicopper oxidase with cupredoxin domain
MTKQMNHLFSGRRGFLKLAGGALIAAAGGYVIPRYLNKALKPMEVADAAPTDPPDLHFVGTDGWISLPASPAISPYHPDDLAPAPFNTYIFGFRNVTGLDATQVLNQKMKAQHQAPLFWTQENVPFKVQLSNLGLAIRPDLVDTHTVHWHGFRNVIPFFDGEPAGSVSVPIGRDFTYVYTSHDPGTYMYHCHVEDVEHVQMGMTGLVFVRPTSNPKWAYNDAATAFDREFAMLLTEVWAEAHWADSHIQLPEWSDYKPDFSLLNGRVYPDTLAPSGSVDPFNPVTDASGDLIPTPGYEHLQYQPYSSLVQCAAGERVLLRFANLGFKQASMTLTGIKMTVVGKDATHLLGRDGTNNYYQTNTVSIAAGESVDAIFTAPAYQGPGPYDTYLLFNRSHSRSSNLSGGFGGQMTEVRVYPSGSLPAQTLPNT